LEVSSVFGNGDVLKDKYSNTEVEVRDGKVTIDSEYDIVLLETK